MEHKRVFDLGASADRDSHPPSKDRHVIPQGRLGPAQLLVVALVGAMMYPVVVTRLELNEQAYITVGLIVLGMLISVLLPQMRRVVLVLSILSSMRYIYWRGMNTLGSGTWGDIIVTSLLFAAEVYGVTILLLGYFQTIKLVRRQAAPVPLDPESLPSVDVFIATYNEDTEILRRTATGAMALDYKRKRVYLLDDGRREDVRALAAEIGCGYVTRTDNSNAKAGNINHAMQQTNGELILILDADHVPVNSFLNETVGFFSSPEVGMVQTPHHFYNPDPFQRNLGVENKIAPESDFFYQVVQVGNDYWNSTFFCGSAGIIRRSALEEIGGIATETVTEDAHTSLRLHAQGYRSVYYSKPLVAGLATERFAYHVSQRVRWARGMTQILRIQNPLFTRGLKLPQRLNYFNAMLHFLFGAPRLIFILAPMTYLLLGLHPVRGAGIEVLLYAMPHIVLATIAASMVSGSFRHSFWSEVYETAIAAYVAPATLLALISPRFGKFNVTSKGGRVEQAEFDTRHAFPVILLTILAVVSLAVVPYRWLTATNEHSSLVINAIWTLYNLIIMVAALIAARDRVQQRKTLRVNRDYSATLLLPTQLGVHAQLADLSETGARLVVDRPLALPLKFGLKIKGDGAETPSVTVKLVWREVVEDGRLVCGIEFVDVDAKTRHSLIRLMFSSSNSWVNRTVPNDRPFRSYLYILTSLFRIGGQRLAMNRTSPRLTRTVKSRLVLPDGRSITGVTSDLSEGGALVSLDDTAAAKSTLLPQQVTLQLMLSGQKAIELKSRVLNAQIESGTGMVRLKFAEVPSDIATILHLALYGSSGSATFPVEETSSVAVAKSAPPARSTTAVRPAALPGMTTAIPSNQPSPNSIAAKSNKSMSASTNGIEAFPSIDITSPPLRREVVEQFTSRAAESLDSTSTMILPKSSLPTRKLAKVQVIANRKNGIYFRPGSDLYRQMMAACARGGNHWIVFSSEEEALKSGYCQVRLAS